MLNFYKDCYAWHGRRSRMGFFLSTIAIVVANFAVLLGFILLLGLVTQGNLLNPANWSEKRLESSLMESGILFGPISIIAIIMIYLVAYFWFVVWPSITTMIARLHDHNLSGWWLLMPLPLGFVLGVIDGALMIENPMLVNVLAWMLTVAYLYLLYLKQGTVGPNRYGRDEVDIRHYVRDRTAEKRAEVGKKKK